MPRRLIALLAVAYGFGLWLACESLLDAEPWDLSLTGYGLALALGGATATWLARPGQRGDIWRWPGGIVLGEVLYMFATPDSWSLWPLAILAYMVLGLPAVFGAWAMQRFLRGRPAR